MVASNRESHRGSESQQLWLVSPNPTPLGTGQIESRLASTTDRIDRLATRDLRWCTPSAGEIGRDDPVRPCSSGWPATRWRTSTFTLLAQDADGETEIGRSRMWAPGVGLADRLKRLLVQASSVQRPGSPYSCLVLSLPPARSTRSDRRWPERSVRWTVPRSARVIRARRGTADRSRTRRSRSRCGRPHADLDR